MEWISSLFQSTCPFCRSTLGSPYRMCTRCADEMSLIYNTPSRHFKIGSLSVVTAGDYEGWWRSLILNQKLSTSRSALGCFAEKMLEAIPADWRETPVTWVPGSVFQNAHLVEELALELGRRGQPLFPKALVRRRLGRHRSQKTLDVTDRKTRDISELYEVCSRSDHGGRVLLLDDIVTTGSTLEGCSKILFEKLGITTQGAIALAYTPLRRV